MSQPKADVDLQPLFRKLGHSLEEIRVRALNNIQSKLSHDVVCEADLVQEKHFLIRLLEWFNFPTCPKQKEVLGLILKMAKHTSAAGLLLDIGAVEFLTQFRCDCSKSLHSLIDEILECLMRLPDTKEEVHKKECIYQQRSPGKVVNQSEDTFHSTALPSELLHPSGSPFKAHYESLRYQSPDEPQVGFFTHVDQQQGNQQNVYFTEHVQATSSGFKFSTFPWLPLTPTDRHVISSTDNSLKSKDLPMVISACDFLSEVVFQDFPAEIFLQRPSIVKTILQLLALQTSENKAVTISAMKTLHDLTVCLKTRMAFYKDPALYSPKQDFNQTSASGLSSPSNQTFDSSDTRPSVIGRSDPRQGGDGRDGNASNSDGSRASSHSSNPHQATPQGNDQPPRTENTDIEDTNMLQFSQMTVPEFCMTLLHKGIPLLKTNDEDLIVDVLRLLLSVVGLLKNCLTTHLHEDTSVAARDIVDKCTECLEIVSEVFQCHFTYSPVVSTNDLDLHRMGNMAAALLLQKMMDVLVPLEKAEAVIPDSLLQPLIWLAYDKSLAYTYPEIRESIMPYMNAVDGDSAATYNKVTDVCQSMKQSCDFLLNCENRNDGNILDLIAMADGSVQSLPYHNYLKLVDEYVNLCCDICRPVHPNPRAVSECRHVLLKVLAHPSIDVKVRAYTACLEHLKNALGISTATRPAPSACQGAVFIIDRLLLYEICCFGMDDSNERVSGLAQHIMLYLLQSQLIMPEHMWDTLLQHLVAIMPVIQGFSGLQSPLGSCILSLVEPNPSSTIGLLPKLERFRGTLRLFYAKESRVRSEGLSRLAWFLTNEEDGATKLPVFADLDVRNLANMFVIKEPRFLEDEEIGKSVFQVEGMLKVYNIFTSSSVDIGVRQSGGYQLALMMADPSLHKVFHDQGGLDVILGYMEQGVKKPGEGDSMVQNEMSRFLPSCICILRHLVHHDYGLRHRLAHDSAIYYLVVRAVLLHHRNDRMLYDSSHLLLLLLFDEVASIETWTPESAAIDKAPKCFSLPTFVSHRYHLPFKAITHHIYSPNRADPLPSPDPLVSGPPASRLKVFWNIAWHGGWDELVEDVTNEDRNKGSDDGFSSRLKLSPSDIILLKTTHLRAGYQQCIYDIMNATSHNAVSKALVRMSGYTVMCTDFGKLETLYGLNWMEGIGRFLQIIPSSASDENLLADLLSFLSLLLKSSVTIPDKVAVWLGEILNKVKGPLLGIISQQDGSQDQEDSEDADNARRRLSKELLSFVHIYTGKLSYYWSKRTFPSCVTGDLTRSLLLRLNLADAPHFYNLPSLESTLTCLANVTARPGWSKYCCEVESTTLCLQLLNCLLEVLSAFHIGRGGMSLSYMGKGVTRNATLCLRHLAHEMSLTAETSDWPRNWLFTKQSSDMTSDPGLNWLIPLWTYRDPEVRAAGLGIAVALTATEAGRITLTTHCQQLTGGVWGAAFSVLLDHSECSIVRQQAFLLLVNLTSQSMPASSGDPGAEVWQGPVIRNPQTQVSVVGIPALLALLHHSQFYQEMIVLLSNYYPYITIHPVSVAGGSVYSPVPSQVTLTTSESGTPEPVPQGGHPGASGDYAEPSRPGMASRTSTITPASQHARETPTSGTTADSSDYQSVSTPCLVSGLTKLLQNLLNLIPQDTLEQLKKEQLHKALLSIADAELLDSCTQDFRTSGQGSVMLQDLMIMYADILKLIQMCVIQDKAVQQEIIEDKNTLKGVMHLLKVHVKASPDLECVTFVMWECVYMLLFTLLNTDTNHSFAELTPVLVKQWDIITASLAVSFQPTSPQTLQLSAVHFLAMLLSKEGRYNGSRKNISKKSVTAVLDAEPEDNTTDPSESDTIFTSITSGSLLCQALIKLYDIVSLKSTDQVSIEERYPVVNALKCLLAVSQCAKIAALEAGLVESIIEHIKHTHVNLNMESLQVGKPSTKRKDDPLIAELIMTFELLRNFMYNSHEVKMSAYESGLSNILHKLWAYCQMESSLMMSCLMLLTTYTARCPAAASSLAFTSPLAVSDPPASKAQYSSNSLVHCLVKLASKDFSKDTVSLLKVVFALLSTLVLSAECRGILWKSNFLHGFSTLCPTKSNKPKAKQVQEQLWLDLMVNLSFFTEGQQLIFKIKDAVDLLLEFCEVPNIAKQQCALLTIRNLCHHPGNKHKLLSGDKLVPLILKCAEAGDDHMITIAVSCLWALVYDNQKAKSVVKTPNVTRKLQVIQSDLKNRQTKSTEMIRCLQHLTFISETISEQN